MKLKNYFVILLLSMLLICCAGTISAADDNIDVNGLNQISDDDSVSAVENNGESISISQDDAVLEDTSGEQTNLSPYDQFVNDLKENSGTVYLKGDIKISAPFDSLKTKTVIDGQGHTIDAQHKAYVFKAREHLTLKNMIIKNGKSDTGGAIYAMNGLTLIDCQFTGNQATNSGGAIFVKGTASVSGTKFTNNHAKVNGGAIYSVNRLTVNNAQFDSNKASSGGAIFAKGTLNIDDSKFNSNSAVDAGGAVCIASGKLNIKNSHFEKNSVINSKSSAFGGAVWIHKSSSSISKSTFKSNTCLSKALKTHKKATKYRFTGGAISYSAGSTHSLSDCKFNGNKASNHGGALFVFKSKSLTINKCEFTKNRAVFEDGGAISFTANKLTIYNSKFKNNLAYEDGGAIDSYSVTGKKIKITIKKSTFESNTGYKCGGAIWMGVKTVYNIANSKFIKNKASSAGALEAEDGVAKITKCTFTSNKAAKVTSWVVKTKAGGRLAHSGGAILVKNHCKIFKCTFKKNKATYGKVVKNEGGKVTAKGNKGYKLN